jgi:DKNYY family
MRRLIAAVCLTALAVLPACSRKTAEVLGGYYVSGDKVFWSGGVDSPGSHEVVGADAASFHSIDNNFGRDKSHVYYDGSELAGADVSSFEIIGGSSFAKDKSHVWLAGHSISDDPTHFQPLDGGLSKDSNEVYCTDGSVFSNDPSHFAILRFSNTDTSQNFTKDGRAVYFMCRPITGADPATFHLLDISFFGYGADDQRVYLDGNTISGADPHTFHVLYDNDWCAADDQRAYHRESVIPNADPRHFPPGQPVTGCSDIDITFGR